MILTVKDVRVTWADAPKPGFQKAWDINLPFTAEGCLHIEATVKLAFITLGKIKLAFCIR